MVVLLLMNRLSVTTRFALLATTLLMVASPLLPGQTARRAQQQRAYTGVVEGDTIWLDEFAREVGRKAQLNALGGIKTSADIVEDTWRALRDDILLHVAADSMGIEVTQQDVDSVLLEDTPQYVKQGFVNDKGRFDKDLLRGMMSDPDSVLTARGMSPQDPRYRAQRNQLVQSMNELRQQVSTQIERERLRTLVMSKAVIDEDAINEKIAKVSKAVIADVVYLPCAQMTSEIMETDLKRWYEKYKDKYTSDDETRRMKVLIWPLVPSFGDSSEVYGQARGFIRALNEAASQTERDSLWQVAAEGLPAGSSSLSPDSSSHADVYAIVKDQQPGSALGPVLTGEGAHVMLVDRVRDDGTVDVRILQLEVEAGQAVIDSVLQDVQKVVADIRKGSSFVEVASKYDLNMVTTKFVGPDEKLYDSYRLVDAAFEADSGGIIGPVDSHEKGVILGVVVDIQPPGTLPYSAARQRVIDEVRVNNACMQRQDAARRLKGLITTIEGGTMFISMKPDDAVIMRDTRVDGSGLIGEQILDPLAAEIISNSESGLKGPFLGDAGWYIISVKEIVNADAAATESYRESYFELYADEQREDHWQSWVNNLSRNAKITDLRWMYFRY